MIVPPVTPVRASAKSAASTPVTDSLKVTVQLTEAAAVGEAAARVIDTTDGGVASAATGPASADVVVQPAKVATTR